MAFSPVCEKFLEKSINFTGLVCIYEEKSYFRVVKALNEKNIMVPRDVSVVGGGRIYETTTVSSDMQEIGRVAVEKLIERLVTPGWQYGRVIVPYKLYKGDSTRRIENSSKPA